MDIKSIINAFNAGELSPLLDGRTDISKYQQGCRTLKNMLVLPYGGAMRRPGTEYIADVKTHSSVVRLIPFQYNTEQTYILEFGNNYIRFYKDGGQIQDSGSPYEISSSYGSSDLDKIQYVQSADVMYLAHPDYPVCKLTRSGHTSWTIAALDFDMPAFKDMNISDTTITPSATSGSITLTASDDIFKAEHVGASFRLDHVRSDNEISGSFTATGQSSSIRCEGNWNFVTHNTWTGTVKIERSFDDGTSWQTYRTYSSADDRNVDVSGVEEEEGVLYRINMSSYTSGTLDYDFTVQDYYNTGIVEITAFTNTTLVTSTVKTELGGTDATKEWFEGAWNEANGYPACVAIYEERLFFARTEAQPQTIWGSRTNDWTDFKTGDFDTHALTYTLAADKVNAIRWLLAQDALLIGTSGGEWKLSGSDSDSALTPSNVEVRRQSNYGSAQIQAQLINETILFVQRQSRKVREFVYNFEKDGYVSPDLTILAEHISDSGIVQAAFQQQPHAIYWCILANGKLAGMTYERDQEVVAWHNHETDGEFESVAVIPGDSTEEDEVWTAVKRTIGGTDKRYIERFKPLDFGDDQTDCFFVDSGLSYDGGAALDISAVTQADPCQITTGLNHGFETGDQIKITGVEGMTELNNQVFSVLYIDDTNFSLKDSTNSFNIDSSAFSAYSSAGSAQKVENTFSGLDHLEGKSVSILADGAVHPDKTVSSGAVTLDYFANKVHIGLPYNSDLQPMKLDIQLPDGTAQGRIKRIKKLIIRFYKSLLCKAGADSEHLDSFITFRDTYTPLGSPPELFTGEKVILFNGNNSRDGNIFIRQDSPLPLAIICLMPVWEVSE
jgi:hypothetical protein